MEVYYTPSLATSHSFYKQAWWNLCWYHSCDKELNSYCLVLAFMPCIILRQLTLGSLENAFDRLHWHVAVQSANHAAYLPVLLSSFFPTVMVADCVCDAVTKDIVQIFSTFNVTWVKMFGICWKISGNLSQLFCLQDEALYYTYI